MKKTIRHRFKLLSFIIVLPASSLLTASELIYQPVNPAFGGYPANGSVLLNNANAQNTYTDPDAETGFDFPDLNKDPLADFKESLNRQVLSLISRKIVEEAFGADTGLGSGGSYTYENYEITITTGTTAISISIKDTQTGEVTELTVPIFASTTQ